jgi:hypothetical protein
MGFPEKRKEMVLAQGIELDVLHQDHIVVVFLEDAVSDGIPGGKVIPPRKELHGLRHSLRSPVHTLPIRLRIEANDHFPYESFERYLGEIHIDFLGVFRHVPARERVGKGPSNPAGTREER